MPAQHINKDDFDSQVLQAKIPVLVDFYAQWCGPCKMAAPVLDKLAEEYKDKVLIVKIDVDQNQELASQYQVMSIPTVIIFKDGKAVDKKIGFPGEGGYRSLIENILSK